MRYHRGVPLPKGGLTLGILALGNLYITMGLGSPTAIRIGCALVAVPLLFTIIGKCLLHPVLVLGTDMSSPIVAPVSATVFMSLMQIASYIAPYDGPAHTLSIALWYFAVSCNIVLMVHITSRFVVHGFAFRQVFPTWFVGYVGIVVASATSAPVHQRPLGLMIFWIGFMLYMVMLAIVGIRVMRIPMEPVTRPTLAIFAAPMSLSVAGYTASAPDPNLGFVLVLIVLAQALFLGVLMIMPMLLRSPFSPAYAAFTFPFVITATALHKVLDLCKGRGWDVPSWCYGLQYAETVFATLMVAMVLVRYMHGSHIRWSALGLSEG